MNLCAHKISRSTCLPTVRSVARAISTANAAFCVVQTFVQYLLFACDPYETIGFKVPNLKIDKQEGRFFTNWEKEAKKFTVRVGSGRQDSFRQAITKRTSRTR